MLRIIDFHSLKVVISVVSFPPDGSCVGSRKERERRRKIHIIYILLKNTHSSTISSIFPSICLLLRCCGFYGVRVGNWVHGVGLWWLLKLWYGTLCQCCYDVTKGEIRSSLFPLFYLLILFRIRMNSF